MMNPEDIMVNKISWKEERQVMYDLSSYVEPKK